MKLQNGHAYAEPYARLKKRIDKTATCRDYTPCYPLALRK